MPKDHLVAQQVMDYLGRYTHKTAITNSRIVRFDSDNNRVQFKYKDYADNSNEKLMEVNACDFVTDLNNIFYQKDLLEYGAMVI